MGGPEWADLNDDSWFGKEEKVMPKFEEITEDDGSPLLAEVELKGRSNKMFILGFVLGLVVASVILLLVMRDVSWELLKEA